VPVKRMGHLYKVMWCIHTVAMPLTFMQDFSRAIPMEDNMELAMTYLKRKYDLVRSQE
jgi:hypothetical protein